VVLAQHVPDSDRLPLQIEGSRRNIEEHYDAGNAMYKVFLDDTMTYSSGIHRPGGPPCSACQLSHPFTECAADSRSKDRLGRASHAPRKHLHTSLSTAGDSLKQAQLNKLDALIEKAGIKETDHVLEVGCGWGSMAIHAVQVRPVLTCIRRAFSMRTMC
jgi:cyclopropane-fatty-acyl-phospholipid synthase